MAGTVMTAAAGANESVSLSGKGLAQCVGTPSCTGTVTDELPEGFQAPLSGNKEFVGTFRIEDPAAFARTAFIEALQANGVTVTASAVAKNSAALLSAPKSYPADTRVAAYESAPYSQVAQLILKVSLNLGANLSLSLFGLEKGQSTIDGALAAERKTLIEDFKLNGDQFSFPTNGSGTPDSQASPRALAKLLSAMAKTKVADIYQAALPVMGVNGSLAHTGRLCPARATSSPRPAPPLVPDPTARPQS